MLIDQNHRQEQLNDPYMKMIEGMSRDEMIQLRDKLLAQKRSNMVQGAVGPLANTLAQYGGIKPYQAPEVKDNGINDFIMKGLQYRQQKMIENELEKERENEFLEKYPNATPAKRTVGGVTYDFLTPEEASKKEMSEKKTGFSDSLKLRQEFIDRPEVKEYKLISTQVKSMDALLNKAREGNIQNKVALDQALITMFNKLTDPNSVVRESEYARTPQNLPLVNAFNGALQKIERGGAGMTDADREALVWGAKVIANERGKVFGDTLQSYIDLSNQYGIDPSLVSRGMESPEEYNVNPTSNITLPPEIRTTSQAVKYLTNQGMSQEEAINWLRSQ